MSADNSDPTSSPHSGPRHPAQHFADHHSEFIVNPPPVGRRISAFVATISVLASAVVLTIAIPKGIDEYSETSDQELANSVPVKGSFNAPLYRLLNNGPASSTLSLGNRYWLSALESVGVEKTMIVLSSNGEEIPVAVVAIMDDIGVAILHATAVSISGPALETEPFIKPTEVSDFSSYQAVDAFEESPAVKGPSLTMATPKSHHDIPISNPECLVGVALLVEANVSRGIIVHRQHSAWVLGTASIDRIMGYVTNH